MIHHLGYMELVSEHNLGLENRLHRGTTALLLLFEQTATS